MTKHPIQPLEEDRQGVIRFKRNAIVCHLLDHGSLDMNDLARLDFTREDREQFAQLIGYSHSGSGDLGYVSDETWKAAIAMFEDGKSEVQARIDDLEEQLRNLRAALREPMAALFQIHPDDLNTEKLS